MSLPGTLACVLHLYARYAKNDKHQGGRSCTRIIGDFSRSRVVGILFSDDHVDSRSAGLHRDWRYCGCDSKNSIAGFLGASCNFSDPRTTGSRVIDNHLNRRK